MGEGSTPTERNPNKSRCSSPKGVVYCSRLPSYRVSPPILGSKISLSQSGELTKFETFWSGRGRSRVFEEVVSTELKNQSPQTPKKKKKLETPCVE